MPESKYLCKLIRQKFGETDKRIFLDREKVLGKAGSKGGKWGVCWMQTGGILDAKGGVGGCKGKEIRTGAVMAGV